MAIDLTKTDRDNGGCKMVEDIEDNRAKDIAQTLILVVLSGAAISLMIVLGGMLWV